MIKSVASLLVLLSVSAMAAERLAAPAAAAPAIQPAPENLDLATISRIRAEGLTRSHIMEYGSGLFDGIGPRLTGSPEFERGAQWCVDQLKRMGVAGAHMESWGDFGMAWTQVGTSLEMTAPSTATLLAQATPWSPATAGEVTGQLVLVPYLTDEKDFEMEGEAGGQDHPVRRGSSHRSESEGSAGSDG